MNFKKILLSIATLALAFQLQLAHADKPKVKMVTSKGTMIIELYPDKAPKSVANFLSYVNAGAYDGTIFHRVIKDFMIQGGDPHSVGAEKGQRLGSGGPGYTIPAEFNETLIHKKGALAAARKGDQVNPEKASNGSQFYLVQGQVLTPEQIAVLEQRGVSAFTEETAEIYTTLGGTPHLDGSYTVYGEVVEGLQVLDSIAAQPCDAYNRPLEDVIFTISIVK